MAPKVVNFQSTPRADLATDLRRRRLPEERGLPSEDALLGLAKTYLAHQGKLWPQCHESGDLPKATNENIQNFARELRERFVQKRVDRFAPVGPGTFWEALAAVYVRYSDEGSNPRSLDQQLIGALDRAKRDGIFVPSEYLFFDAAVTATTPIRNGYQLAKKCVEIVKEVRFLIVDELSRANRYNLESMRLGDLMNRLDKHILGVADNFDSRQPMAKLTLAIFGALNEWFIDQLRSKVRRGMGDAFHRGTSLGLPAIGYVLVPATDAAGNRLIGADGALLQMLAVDEIWKPWIIKAFELCGEQKWSRDRIAELFNQNSIGGKRSWNSSGIRQLLTRHKYVGIDVYNMTYRVFNGEGHVIKTRPRSEWKIRRVRHLQIVSWTLWKKVQKRMDASKKAYTEARSPKSSRAELHPKTLLRPICGCCHFPMILGRSGKYASFTCMNGLTGAHGCTFKGYKSVSIVENSILDHLKIHVLTDDRIEKLVAAANEHLATIAASPKEDAKPIEQEIRSTERKLANLYKFVEEGGMREGGKKRVKALEDELNRLRKSLVDLQARNAPPPKPIGVKDAKRHLATLRGLLQLDVGRASAVLNELTGPITIRQVNEVNRTKPAWIADFSLDFVPAVVRLAKESHCPTANTLEYLRVRGWTMPLECSVEIQKQPEYQKVAGKAVALKAQGFSKELIAAELGVSFVTVTDALCFAETGCAPKTKPRLKHVVDVTSTEPQKDRYSDISAEVLRLRDEEQVSFKKIAKLKGKDQNTIRRAYAYGHREDFRLAMASGKRPSTGRYSHLGPEKFRQIRKLLGDGLSVVKIVKTVGVSANTVYRERDKMRQELAAE